MIKQTCVILCGGKSSRMGQNKALLSFGETTLLKYLVEKYKKIFQSVYLSCKDEYREKYTDFDVPILIEKSPIYSPMIGLQTALEEMRDFTFVVSVDCPFLSKRHFIELEEKFLSHSNDIVYAKTPQKSHYLIGVYSKNILPSLKEKIEKRDFKMSSFVEAQRSEFVAFKDEESFMNLNTPYDYSLALERINHG